MSRTTIVRTINAPIDEVFKTVSDISNFSKAIDDIVNVEFLSDQKSGVGTRFRETRMMGKREAKAVLEVTELVENTHVRLVSDEGGTIWDSIFSVSEKNGQAELTLQMDANAYKFFSKLMNPLMKGMIAKAIARDMDAVKAWCEKGNTA